MTGAVTTLHAARDRGRGAGQAPGAATDTVAALAASTGMRTASALADEPPGSGPLGEPLPVLPELAGLLPSGGLRRGSTITVLGSRALLLSLLAEATTRGSWAAVVGTADLGVAAADELGVAVRRLAVIAEPGAELVGVVAAVLDGIDLVVVDAAVSPSVARRLAARARHTGAVLLVPGVWPGADVELRCTHSGWRGVDRDGHGYLAGRDVIVRAAGRGAAAREVTTRLVLPGPRGTVESAVLATGDPTPLLAEAG